MSTVVLTVRGPERGVDLAAPADTPIEQLLPTFFELTAPGAPARGLDGRRAGARAAAGGPHPVGLRASPTAR